MLRNKPAVRVSSESSGRRLAAVSAAAITLSLAAPAVWAQTTPADPDRDVVVVTGAAVPTEYEKIGSSLTVIGEAQIEEGGYTYIPDVLRQVPGLAVSRTGPVGGMTQVRTRGAEGNHTVVLFNGVDVSDAGDGEADLSTLLSGNIERVEVLRGPQSGLYGSNALAGVINIITRKNIDGSFVTASGEYGTDNAANVTGGYGMGDGRNYVDVGVAGSQSDGYDTSVRGADYGPSTAEGDDEGYDNLSGYVSGGAEVSPILRFDGFARYVYAYAELDGDDGSPYDDGSQSRTRTYNLAGSGTLSLMDGAWVTIGSASYTSAFGSGDGGFGRYGDKSRRTKFGIQSSYKFGSGDFLSTLIGFAESKKEYYRNIYPSSPSQVAQERELVGLGGQYLAEIASQFYLSATLRHDDNDSFEDADTYSVAASWVIPNTGTRLHASFGTGVTNPSFFEQFGYIPATFDPNPNLKPEEAEGFDIGVEQTWFDGGLVVDLTYFKSTLENEITTVYGGPPNYPSTPINATGESDRSGVEVYVRYNPIDDIDLIGSYTYLDATDIAGPEVRRPENQASLDASWRVNGGPLRLNLGVTYNGDQLDNDFSAFPSRRVTLDAYSLVRAGVSYQLNDQIELYGRVENAFDEDYQEVFGYRGSPQAAFVGVRFKDGSAKK